MKLFYVRPARDGGYGAGDGSSYENAWNGWHGVDWAAVRRAEPATVWVCGDAAEPSAFMTVHVELSYLEQGGDDLEPRQAGPIPRRESPQPV